MYDARPGELAQVMWGYGRLRLPGVPGKTFLDAVCETLNASAEQFSPQVCSGTRQ
jgi:hypothetical protein